MSSVSQKCTSGQTTCQIKQAYEKNASQMVKAQTGLGLVKQFVKTRSKVCPCSYMRLDTGCTRLKETMKFKKVLDKWFHRTKHMDIKIPKYSKLVLFRHYSCQEVHKLTNEVIVVFGGLCITAHSTRRTDPQISCL